MGWLSASGKRGAAGANVSPPATISDLAERLVHLERMAAASRDGARPVYAYLGGGRAVTRTHRGHLLFIDTADLTIAPHLALSGVWERSTEDVVHRLLRPGDLAIEVGANMGYHTVAMAERIGPDGWLYTFEANRKLIPLLRASLAANGLSDRVTLVPKAALDRACKLLFEIDPTAVGGGHVLDADALLGDGTGPWGFAADRLGAATWLKTRRIWSGLNAGMREVVARRLGSEGTADAELGRWLAVDSVRVEAWSALVLRLGRALSAWERLPLAVRDRVGRAMGFDGAVGGGRLGGWLDLDPTGERWVVWGEQVEAVAASFDVLPESEEIVPVECVALDDIVLDTRPVALLRMDVEGVEPLVLHGARRILRNSPDIVIVAEWAVSMMKARSGDVAEHVRDLETQGFRFWRIAETGMLDPVGRETLMGLPLCDVVIARRDVA